MLKIKTASETTQIQLKINYMPLIKCSHQHWIKYYLYFRFSPCKPSLQRKQTNQPDSFRKQRMLPLALFSRLLHQNEAKSKTDGKKLLLSRSVKLGITYSKQQLNHFLTPQLQSQLEHYSTTPFFLLRYSTTQRGYFSANNTAAYIIYPNLKSIDRERSIYRFYQTNQLFQLQYTMDQTALAKAKIYPEDELSNHTNSELAPSSRYHPHPRKPKKDALREKKRNKALEKKLAATDYQEVDNASTKQKSDEDHSPQDISVKASSSAPQVDSNNCSQNLVVLVNKPPYLSINNKNWIVGDYGHATAFFKRPLIQGTYFLEFTVKEDAHKQKKVKSDSAVRVGICQANFNPVFPLGYKQSIGYKSIDGSIIYRNQKIGSAEPFKVGDTITVCLKLGPLQKFRNPETISEENCLTFYKNGRLMFQFRETKQVFYCLGVSCYNYSQIQVNTKQECSYIPQGSHYFKCLKQKIPYKDLEHNKLFNI